MLKEYWVILNFQKNPPVNITYWSNMLEILQYVLNNFSVHKLLHFRSASLCVLDVKSTASMFFTWTNYKVFSVVILG